MARLGYRRIPIVVVDNGLEAIEALTRQPYDKFDLVLMDVQMPEMDGLEATAQIRRQEQKSGGHIPIIALTAHAMKNDETRFLQAGMDAYVAKPIHTSDLFAVIDRLTHNHKPAAPTSAKTAGAAIEPVLAPEGLEQLRKLEEGGYFSVAEYIDLFLSEGPLRIEAMASALQAADAPTLQREAHTLKGSSRELAARRLATVCLQMEELAKAGQLTSGETLLEEIKREYALVETELGQQAGNP